VAPVPLRDPDSVYRVVQLVAAHPDSWEAAAAAAIEEATKTISDLRVAQVTELDTLIGEGGGPAAYRVRLKVSYRIDRRRRSPDTGEVRTVRLTAAIRDRLDAGPAEFHVLVPATMSRDYAAARRLATFSVDPTSGYTFGDLAALPQSDAEGHRKAQERLDEQLWQLRAVGAEPTGEVGEPEPLDAIATVLERSSFDEILLSTLPPGISRWVRMDLPSRLERRFGLPLTHVHED
jgi:flavin-binding protein dodecin